MLRSVQRPHRDALAMLLGLVPLLVGAAAGDPSSPALPAPAVVVVRGPVDRPVVALTFDDGWSPAATAAIVAELQAAQVSATFFPQSDGVRKDPALWRRIAALGYPIGDHSIDHPDLTTLSTPRVLEELEDSRSEIEAITRRPMIAIARAPYGRTDERVLRAMREAGFPTTVLWEPGAVDWAQVDPLVIASAALRGTNGSIILLHAGPPAIVQALPDIIAGYRARGIRLRDRAGSARSGACGLTAGPWRGPARCRAIGATAGGPMSGGPGPRIETTRASPGPFPACDPRWIDRLPQLPRI